MNEASTVSATRGRWLVVIAALLWSLGALFTRLLQRDTILGLNEPALSPLQIATFRALFAGLFFLPALRPRDITFRPLMLVMVACFAVMSGLYMCALGYGPAANAILLQNTSPFFVYLFCVHVLGEPADKRSWQAIKIGLAGVALIIIAGWIREGMDRVEVTGMAMGSAIAYGAVILCLRTMRGESTQWLVMQNHLGAALCLSLAVLFLWGFDYWQQWITMPSPRQLAFLMFFGAIQMGLPYWLFARGLRAISPQEAGAITLLEPLLNPIWAYFIAPETETPPITTWIGGGLILGALAWRYSPRSRK
jgi:drug/metabolite transporter (DMT)-like permease